MSIEIRQLMIKSDIVQRCGVDKDEDSKDDAVQQQDMKEQVLAECRKLIVTMLSERGER